ncbi:phosphotransferase [bacterium]|nr:phosphotransferase [bacterium]
MNDVVASLIESLSRALPGWMNGDAAIDADTVSTSLRNWSYQVAFTAHVGDRSVPMLAKVPRWEGIGSLAEALDAGAQDATREEYATLVSVHRAVLEASDPGLTSVVPVGYLESANTLVAEVLDAAPLRTLVGARKRNGTDLVEVFRRTGRWLRLFHDGVGVMESAPFPTEDVTAEVHALEARMSDLGPAPPGWGALLAQVRRSGALLEGHLSRIGGIHGDFNLSNVLVTGEGRVAVLDPNLETAPAEFDPAKLMVEVRTGRERALGPGALRPASTIDRWENALTTGYGAIDRAIWVAARRIALARRWVEVEERWSQADRMSPAGMGLLVLRRRLQGESLRLFEERR